MRLSLLFTMARKHKKSLSETVKLFSKNVCISILNKKGKLKSVNRFWTANEINSYSVDFEALKESVDKCGILKQHLFRSFLFKEVYKECYFKNCFNVSIAMHYVSFLYEKMKHIYSAALIKKRDKKNFSFSLMESFFDCTKIPLCKIHNIYLYKNKLSLNVFKSRYKPIRILSRDGTQVF